jgi:hypothetical protein
LSRAKIERISKSSGRNQKSKKIANVRAGRDKWRRAGRIAKLTHLRIDDNLQPLVVSRVRGRRWYHVQGRVPRRGMLAAGCVVKLHPRNSWSSCGTARVRVRRVRSA